MNPRRLTIRFPRDHPGPWPGDAMESTGGTFYLMLAVRRVQHRTPQRDQVWVIMADRLDYLPLDTLVHPFTWDRRRASGPNR